MIGIAIWGGEYDDKLKTDPPANPTTLGVFAALMAILSGVFLILDVLGVGSGSSAGSVGASGDQSK